MNRKHKTVGMMSDNV